ncbi:MAG: hypothetical protein R8K22_04965, partial [Mariprofundaceae bacterium]
NTAQGFGDTGKEISGLLKKHRHDLDQLLKELPQAAHAGESFFIESILAMKDFRELIIDNRENLYRTLFELRKTYENLEAFSGDISRNPWKLMSEKPEIKASRHAQQDKMEEMLLTTGQGVRPARP